MHLLGAGPLGLAYRDLCPASHPLPWPICLAFRASPCRSYVAEMHQLSLRGMTSQGFAGKHELVVGGFKQVGYC